MGLSFKASQTSFEVMATLGKCSASSLRWAYILSKTVLRRFRLFLGLIFGLYADVALSKPTSTAASSGLSCEGVVLKYVLAAVLMPKAFEPKSTVLAYISRISFFVQSSSNSVAMIISLLFMMRMLNPGTLPSKPVEYCVRTRNIFFTSCCEMVEAPRARPCVASFRAAKSPCTSTPWWS